MLKLPKVGCSAVAAGAAENLIGDKSGKSENRGADQSGLYQDENGADWPDNALHFGLLSHVASPIANKAGGRWRPDFLHANDWNAGLPPELPRFYALGPSFVC